MVVTCEEVWREISNYLDDEVAPDLRSAMEEHLHMCQKCSAVLDGTRNVIGLYEEDRMFEPPQGYSQRLHQRLEQNMPRSRRGFLGWMVAAAAAVLLAGGFELGRSAVSREPALRSGHAQPGTGVPPEIMVVVEEDGKTFHRAGCRFIHDKAKLRTITAREASREGYSPCVRCMKKYLIENASYDATGDDDGEFASSEESIPR
ncbi:MAG TPA: zf-HC2 domain-containing protein [Terriglobales bacterium]|nr:zf-HC2 domain-containing protein [Terriglobales bacterium]